MGILNCMIYVCITTKRKRMRKKFNGSYLLFKRATYLGLSYQQSIAIWFTLFCTIVIWIFVYFFLDFTNKGINKKIDKFLNMKANKVP